MFLATQSDYSQIELFTDLTIPDCLSDQRRVVEDHDLRNVIPQMVALFQGNIAAFGEKTLAQGQHVCDADNGNSESDWSEFKQVKRRKPVAA